MHGSLRLSELSPRSRLQARLKLPVQACQPLAELAPRPNLPDLRLEGRTWMDASLDVDLSAPKDLKLKVDGDLEGCTIATLGADMDRRVRRLRGRFVHRPVVRGEPVGVKVGPGTSGYVKLADIPDWLEAAAIATEDRAFYKHDGLRLNLVRGALKLNLEKRRYVYGGSTITQQLVKNLFLTRRKDLTRKLEEAVIATQIERKLSKDRILELYLNCIEYGPGIWGLSTASQVYFDRTVSSLTHVEGVYLMAIKPYPKHGFWNAKRGKWKSNWVRRMRKIFQRIHKMGAISDTDYQGAAPLFRPVFRIGTSHAETAPKPRIGGFVADPVSDSFAVM